MVSKKLSIQRAWWSLTLLLNPSSHDRLTHSFTVSQFTLLASTKKGHKPDFHGAMGGSQAKELYDYFVSQVREKYSIDKVKDGVFQAMMEVALVNDGPVIHLTLQPLGVVG